MFHLKFKIKNGFSPNLLLERISKPSTLLEMIQKNITLFLKK